ncbi:hypothetical protein VitviT2T_015665 [Vitis vinifera]|uniref:WRKY domain-containing protein n=2 Tax=Vitis vinifera TaxID=29760 RepID=A0ABY9CR92_VITVI|nr:probable WRKY transcription factor 14 [Vitis vinifera]WJZ97031.1 hypothetical protein VitviT2T_015665 [Vitis vinifera]|eukprot:XP_002269170.1 PREDICTED: probable WRKY transcription factor 14 [Vitis vinifera]
MCSYFRQRMENYQGDLADIVRASGSGGARTSDEPVADWQFPSEPMIFSPVVDEPLDDFGDPFSNMRDPLLHELGIAGSGFFGSSNSSELTQTSGEDTSSNLVGGGGMFGQKILDEDMKRPCNIFSRMLQISPNARMPISPCESQIVAASPTGIKTSALAPNDMISGNSSKGCLMDSTALQISSPRNPGIKRRKSQAKKVVCIPAPAAANSRPSGEVVPSDLWAWRKYGQKPIKGSPYPRGYYRCSSSKGCSARKQVERSRTDPNMLVITYTSEHNHPWPTQRNALAGSTRSQPSKNNGASKNSGSCQSTQKATGLKEENKESYNNDDMSPIVGGSSTTGASVKEEMGNVEKQLEMDDSEFSEGFPRSYKPAMPDSNQSEDFFADLGEIEADPLNLLFAQGFSSGDHEERESKALDPFSLFDWTGNNSNTSFGEDKRGL